MCSYQPLYHNAKTGYVIRCTECEKIQVAFGNLVMTFNREDFNDFRLWIKMISNDRPEYPNPMTRCIMIAAPCQGIQLLLSAVELAELASLLECADTELQSLHLISLFDQ
jgi:hypothetical protein